MQTFLPYPSFEESAKCLDYRRLGKQRVEAQQLINAIQDPTKGWAKHPAAKMWEGYIEALYCYRNACILEWIRRGYKNSMEYGVVTHPKKSPPWLGDKAFHDSHKSNLLRKDPKYYGKFDWNVPDDLPYIWPTNQE